LSVTPEEKVLWEKATLLAEDNLQARELFEKLKTNKMQLKGKRVLLNKPEVKESQFELSESDKHALEMDMRKTWTKLEVYAIGDEVESVKVGDKVYMGITGLQASEAVELEDGMKLMVAERDIAIVW
jgi:S-adenosylmethionine:tRNA-ribosyltransferase-isomerase (queuine synthetase)